MRSSATTVEGYLAGLPADRRAMVDALRSVILANLNDGFEEGVQYGMIGYFVPHRVFPDGYHCDPRQPLPFAGLASQKNHVSLYMMSAYVGGTEERWIRDRFASAGKKLDMGKCCIRFRKPDDIPLDVIGTAFRRVTCDAYVGHYLANLRAHTKSAGGRAAKTPAPAGKQPAGSRPGSPKKASSSARTGATKKPRAASRKKTPAGTARSAATSPRRPRRR